MTTPRALLGTSRLLIGLASWVAPAPATRFFGLHPTRADPFLTRLFGSRELALAGSLLAAPPAAAGRIAALGAVVDGLDAIAGARGYRRGELSTRAAILGPAGAALFVVLGVLAARAAPPVAA